METIMLDFFKVFSDIQRIRLAALLSQGPHTLEQIAEHLKVRPVEVPRQLHQLEKLGLLVRESSTYRLDTKALERLSREVLANQRPQAAEASSDESADAYDRKVVKNYSLPGGRLREIPLQDKKLQAILRHVLQVFEPGTRYTEKQVNTALASFHEDTAFLRRALVDHKLIERENNGSAYWRN